MYINDISYIESAYYQHVLFPITWYSMNTLWQLRIWQTSWKKTKPYFLCPFSADIVKGSLMPDAHNTFFVREYIYY